MENYFNEKKNSYIVYKGEKSFTYSITKYGKYASVMAKYSLKTGIKLKNWYEEKDDHIVIYTYYKPEDCYKEILVDKEDYDKVKDYYWSVDKHRHEYYALTSVGTAGKNKTKLRIHRVIMEPKEGEVIDHVGGNALDNRRSNLRITDVKGNNRNKVNLSKVNTSGTTGVYLKGNAWVAQWVGSKTDTRHQKSFNITKYGDEAAKQMAIDHRAQMMEKNKEN